MIKRFSFSSPSELAKAAAVDLNTRVSELLETKNRVDLVLTGGTIGIKTLEELSPLWSSKDLDKVHIWWGDERFVPAASDDRNEYQAYKVLISKLNIPKENVHSMPADRNQDLRVAGEDFARAIEQENPQFDIVLLGMGPDGHVASLFPGSNFENHGEWIVTEENSPKPPSKRMSLSYKALNSAAEVWFLVAGAEKANAVARVFSNEDLPAAKVNGRENTYWYLDEAAQGQITS